MRFRIANILLSCLLALPAVCAVAYIAHTIAPRFSVAATVDGVATASSYSGIKRTQYTPVTYRYGGKEHHLVTSGFFHSKGDTVTVDVDADGNPVYVPTPVELLIVVAAATLATLVAMVVLSVVIVEPYRKALKKAQQDGTQITATLAITA